MHRSKIKWHRHIIFIGSVRHMIMHLLASDMKFLTVTKYTYQVHLKQDNVVFGK